MPADIKTQTGADGGRHVLVEGAESIVSAYWYMLPVAVIIFVGACQCVCQRICAWSDRRRMRAFTRRSCLQKMRSRLCGNCGVDPAQVPSPSEALTTSPATAAARSQETTKAISLADTTDASAAAGVDKVDGAGPAAPSLKLDKDATSRRKLNGSTTPSSALRLESPLKGGLSASVKSRFSPAESPMSGTSEERSLTTSSFEENLTPRCVPNYSVTQRRSIEEQRRATVEDWLEAKRALGEASKAEL